MQFSSTKILRVLSMYVCLCSNMAYVRLCVWVEVSECLGRFLCASSLLSLDKRDDLWDLTEMTLASKSTDVTKQTQKSTSVAVADSSTSEDNNCNKHMQQWPFFLVGIENVAFAFVCACVCVCTYVRLYIFIRKYASCLSFLSRYVTCNHQLLCGLNHTGWFKQMEMGFVEKLHWQIVVITFAKLSAVDVLLLA